MVFGASESGIKSPKVADSTNDISELFILAHPSSRLQFIFFVLLSFSPGEFPRRTPKHTQSPGRGGEGASGKSTPTHRKDISYLGCFTGRTVVDVIHKVGRRRVTCYFYCLLADAERKVNALVSQERLGEGNVRNNEEMGQSFEG